MPTKITNLDWRSDDATIASQETTINAFLNNKTLVDWTAVDEYLVGFYTNTPAANPPKIKVFKLIEGITQNGLSATETTINNFLQSNTLTKFVHVDEGVFIISYE